MRYSPTFIFLIVILISRTCLSKNHEDDKLREIAINAARSNGCFDTYNGKLDTRITNRSSCFAGGFVKEVLIVRKCDLNECDGIRMAPFAKVTFNCDLTPRVRGMKCKSQNQVNDEHIRY
jgi:hypothetical protein